MENKSSFILSNNNSKYLKRASSSKIIRNEMNKIFSRIPNDILKNSEELKQLVFKEKRPTYDIININKKPNKIKITHDMSDQQQNNIKNINSFREDIYEFNKEENSLFENFSKIQKENNIFGNQYHNLKIMKNKYKTGTYLDYNYLIPIGNKYSHRGIKVPKINSEKSVFSGNPLILSGSELEHFIVYNLGDRIKGTNFLRRLKDIIDIKEKGNMISIDEIKQINELERPEEKKGYIPPEILIPKLQNEIEISKNTIDNINDLEQFFQDDSGYKSNKKSFNILNKIENSESKIKIKRNLSFLKQFYNNSKLNMNNSTNISNVDNSSPTSLKNNFNIKSSSNNSLKKDKSKLFIFSRLPSFDNDTKLKNDNRFSIISKINNIHNKRKSVLPSMNFLTKNINIRFSKISPINNIRRSILNNSADTKNKILSRNFFGLNNFSYNSKNEQINNDESENSELELISALNNKNKKGLNKLELNLSDDYNIIFNKATNESKKYKLKKLQIKTTKNEKTEQIFNMILNDKKMENYKSKIEIEKFLKERGFDISKKIDNKLLFKNMEKVEKEMQNKILQEECKIRGELINTKYKKLLEKEALYSKQIKENTFKFKKIIYEKNIDKDEDL